MDRIDDVTTQEVLVPDAGAGHIHVAPVQDADVDTLTAVVPARGAEGRTPEASVQDQDVSIPQAHHQREVQALSQTTGAILHTTRVVLQRAILEMVA